MAELDVAAALRTVAERLGRRPWTVGVEEAFRELAAELERMERNLDPLPFLYTGENHLKGTRMAYNLRDFYPPEMMQFKPHPEFEQNEREYGNE